MTDAANIEYSFSYLPCQTCHAKIHCDSCEQTIADRLLQIEGVLSGEVSIPRKLILIQSNSANPDEIDDEMDAIGVFLG